MSWYNSSQAVLWTAHQGGSGWSVGIASSTGLFGLGVHNWTCTVFFISSFNSLAFHNRLNHVIHVQKIAFGKPWGSGFKPKTAFENVQLRLLQCVDQSSLLAQGTELRTGIVEGNHDALLLGGRVITVTNVDGASLLLLRTNDCSGRRKTNS